MHGLIIDTTNQPWEESRGFQLAELERPSLDEAHNSDDASSVIVKVKGKIRLFRRNLPNNVLFHGFVPPLHYTCFFPLFSAK